MPVSTSTAIAIATATLTLVLFNGNVAILFSDNYKSG